MAKKRINSAEIVSRRIISKKKPEMSGEISSLVQAFEYFAENTEKMRESYDMLQEQISVMDLELTKKNDELDTNLRTMDSIKNHLENILESMTMGVIVLNLDGDVSIFNREASEISGFSRKLVIDKPYADTLGKNVPLENSPLFTLYKGVEKRNKEKVITTKKGQEIPVEYSTSLVTNMNGEILGVVELFSDLREIKKLQEEVLQSRTLAALGEMAGNVAHELRNPLGGIGGFAALLERDLDRDDPRRRLVQKIIEGVARLNRIATTLLFYTRPVKPKRRPENIVQVIEDVLTLIQVELEQEENTITLEKKFEIDSLEVTVDPDLFQQVMLNIVKNAVEAMDYSGLLVVGVKHDKKKERVEVYIKDSGTGINEEEKKKLFLPFFTTKADGTGLGLSIAKKIIEAHNGEISVGNNEDGGSIFSIDLPL
ncbi:PAS domain S-box protein [candidate division KSB1 bacterium]|nr:PAS domain S-box protein [candidate division KSB1 bacterium]